MSVSAVALTNCVLLALVMRRHVGSYMRREFVAPGARIALATAGMGVVCLGVRHGVEWVVGVSFLADLLAVAACGAVSVVVFAVLARALRVAEAEELVAGITSRLRRRR